MLLGSRQPDWALPYLVRTSDHRVDSLRAKRARYSGLRAPDVFICVRQVAPESGNRAGWRPAQYSRR